jgi:hypothetical protein
MQNEVMKAHFQVQRESFQPLALVRAEIQRRSDCISFDAASGWHQFV